MKGISRTIGGDKGSPEQINKLIQWFDSSTINHKGGFSSWKDLSHSKVDAKVTGEPKVGITRLNQLSVVDIQPKDTVELELDVPGGFQMFMVARCNTTESNGFLVNIPEVGRIVYGKSPSMRFRVFEITVVAKVPSFLVELEDVTLEASQAGSKISLGVPDLACSVAEILIYNSPLKNWEAKNNHRYLKQKWGLK